MPDAQFDLSSTRMRKHVIEKNVHIWKLLRSPFTLPTLTCKTHICDWEIIDLDVYGCCTCSQVHVCAYGSCETVETEDGLVCALTGVVVHTKRFVETEFVDTVCLFGTEISDAHESMHAQVSTIVTCILCSNTSNRIRDLSLSVVLRKSSEICLRNFRQNKNLVLTCILLLQSFNKTQYIFTYMTKQKRQELVKHVVISTLQIFHLLIAQGMCIRSNEVQRLAVGALYLMRHGVYNDSCVVLERKKELKMLLPPESTLLDNYGIHPKYITEMENRLKFCLRHKSADAHA